MSRSCLVHVFHPGNVLAALSAVKYYGLTCHGGAYDDVVTLVHNPGLSDPIAREAGTVVERIIASQGWTKPIVLTAGEMDEITRPTRLTSYSAVLKRFRQQIGRDHVDEVFFSFDVMGRAIELAMNAYPSAERITFGDALGLVYNKQYNQTLASGTHPDLTARIKELLKKILSSHPRRILKALNARFQPLLIGRPLPLDANKAVLILPMDQTGDYLDGRELIVVPRQLVLDIISSCQKNISELGRYSQGLLADTPAPHYLMLLDTFSEGNFTSFECEVAMYEEIVRRNVPKGATVFVKTHPLSVNPVAAALHSRLCGDFNTQIISRELSRYPMELWSDLIRACQVISMSYCIISLAFLYDKQVIYPLDSALIESFVPQRFWDLFKNADSMYRNQLTSLANWDGHSVLWKGALP
jgi:hypothetical protein